MDGVGYVLVDGVDEAFPAEDRNLGFRDGVLGIRTDSASDLAVAQSGLCGSRAVRRELVCNGVRSSAFGAKESADYRRYVTPIQATR